MRWGSAQLCFLDREPYHALRNALYGAIALEVGAGSTGGRVRSPVALAEAVAPALHLLPCVAAGS